MIGLFQIRLVVVPFVLLLDLVEPPLDMQVLLKDLTAALVVPEYLSIQPVLKDVDAPDLVFDVDCVVAPVGPSEVRVLVEGLLPDGFVEALYFVFICPTGKDGDQKMK